VEEIESASVGAVFERVGGESNMKRIWLLLTLVAMPCWAAYPAGIWQASSKTEIVTLMVLPDGLFYGQVALAPAGYGCVYLIAGNFVHGGTASIEANYTSLQSPYLEPSACKAEGGGGAVASLSGASLKLLAGGVCVHRRRIFGIRSGLGML
jgi:hypothetical protein